MFKRTRLFGMSLLSVSALMLASCTNSEQDSTANSTAGADPSTASSASTVSETQTESEDQALTLEDGVVRASAEDNPMTPIFGTLVNHTDEDVNVTGFTADVAAGSYEIHEVVDGAMQEKPGGVTIAAGEEHELAPGGDHFMILDLEDSIAAGDVVTLNLELSDGSTVEIEDVPVRSMSAGDEDYGSMDMDHGEMEHEH